MTPHSDCDVDCEGQARGGAVVAELELEPSSDAGLRELKAMNKTLAGVLGRLQKSLNELHTRDAAARKVA